MSYAEISGEGRAIASALLPAEQGRKSRPSHDNRHSFNGMLRLARAGALRRALPAEYGKWSSVYRRFLRWAEQGVFEEMYKSLACLRLSEAVVQMIDGTIVKSHQHAAGVKGGIKMPKLLADPEAVFPRKSYLR